MNILYIGDIMGERGVEAARQALPKLRREYSLDLVIAQGENVTEGKGISVADFNTLKSYGIHAVTGGNWTLHKEEIYPNLNDTQQPIVRPANYPDGTPGLGWKYVDSKQGKVLLISLLGKIVGKDAERPVDNPLHVVDAILEAEKDTPKVATIINFHGDYSSEKVVIGYYLDGRASMVVGDHWHVPTADALVLPHGTAHMTDVGMCGALHSSLGVKTESIISRWRDGKVTRNELETSGPLQFNAALVSVNESTGLATSIKHIQQMLD